MRVKVIVPEGVDFDRVVREVNQFGSIYVKSKRRRFISTEDPPAEERAELRRRGIKIVEDRQYDMER